MNFMKNLKKLLSNPIDVLGWVLVILIVIGVLILCVKVDAVPSQAQSNQYYDVTRWVDLRGKCRVHTFTLQTEEGTYRVITYSSPRGGVAVDTHRIDK